MQEPTTVDWFDGQYYEQNPGQYHEVNPGQYHEENPGQYHEQNPGQYEEEEPGQYQENLDDLTVDFNHKVSFTEDTIHTYMDPE